MRGIRWRIKKEKKAYEQYMQEQYEQYMEEQYWTQSDSWSPKTTRVACSRRPWKQPARPQEPPNALRNAADRPSAPWAQQDARCTARPGVGTADSPSAACAPQNARVPCSASTPAGGTPAAPAKEPEAASPPQEAHRSRAGLAAGSTTLTQKPVKLKQKARRSAAPQEANRSRAGQPTRRTTLKHRLQLRLRHHRHGQGHQTKKHTELKL